jgi:fructosamine-3-kinase
VHEDSATPWLARLEAVTGPGRIVRPLGGSAVLVETGGRALVAKIGPGARDEAEGLLRLGAVRGAPPVPEVVLVEDGLVVTTAVEEGPRTDRHDEALGRSLATLHGAPLDHWGGGSSWIGACNIDPAPRPDGPSFYRTRLTALAARCGLESAVARVTDRLDALLPPGGPSLVHGDLWWGNVLSGTDARAWVIDPSVHGGHPEEDLAMLALFGTVPPLVLATYEEVHPLHDGWRERVELFQLYPLLVHAVLFGGGYGDRAAAIARRFG